jgi:cytochrome c oxidase subunit 2
MDPERAAAPKSKPLVIPAIVAVVAGGIVIAVATSGGSREPATLQPAASASDEQKLVEEVPVELGKKLFAIKGCNACHTIDGRLAVGPTFAGAWGRDVEIVGGAIVKFDEAYFRESIEAPNAKVRMGFIAAHPPNQDKLTEVQMRALVAYARSLAGVAVRPR